MIAALRFIVGVTLLWLSVTFFSSANGVSTEAARAMVIGGSVFLVGAANLLLTGCRCQPTDGATVGEKRQP